MNSMMRRPSSTPSSELYCTPRRTSRSAKPITPRPMRRMRLARSVISGSGYWFASMTLSRKCVDSRTTRRYSFQSIFSYQGASAGISSRTKAPTFTEPRLQTS